MTSKCSDQRSRTVKLSALNSKRSSAEIRRPLEFVCSIYFWTLCFWLHCRVSPLFDGAQPCVAYPFDDQVKIFNLCRSLKPFVWLQLGVVTWPSGNQGRAWTTSIARLWSIRHTTSGIEHDLSSFAFHARHVQWVWFCGLAILSMRFGCSSANKLRLTLWHPGRRSALRSITIAPMDRKPAGNYYSLDFWHVLMYICCIMHGLQKDIWGQHSNWTYICCILNLTQHMQVQSAIHTTLRPEMQRKSGCSGKLEISGRMLSLLVGFQCR